MKRAFTLIELLVVIAIIAILAAILFPVFAKAKEAARKAQCISNTKQQALAALMYAGDWDDTLPLHDNNASCVYISLFGPAGSPCDTPDWGDFTYNTGGTAASSSSTMIWGALRPYHKSDKISICPIMGDTKWAQAFSDTAWMTATGIVPPAGGYVASEEYYYYSVLGQGAYNTEVVDYGRLVGGANNRPGAIRGNLTLVARPADVIMSAAESTWDWDQSVVYDMGNGLVWGSWPNVACYGYAADGWTRYVHNGQEGFGMAYYGSLTRDVDNPNLQGLAVFSFTDGHAKVMRFAEAERCDPVPDGQTWQGSAATSSIVSTYYPHWVPEI